MIPINFSNILRTGKDTEPAANKGGERNFAAACVKADRAGQTFPSTPPFEGPFWRIASSIKMYAIDLNSRLASKHAAIVDGHKLSQIEDLLPWYYPAKV